MEPTTRGSWEAARRRVRALAGFFLGALSLLMVRLAYVQMVEAPRVAQSVLGTNFRRKEAVTVRSVCRQTWLLANASCPDTESWSFPPEEKLRECPIHHEEGR